MSETARSEYLRTDDVDVEALTPFPGNARRGRVDVIKESLTEHGQYRSLVVRLTQDDRMVVLAGNHTLAALKELGVGSARCELIVCDDATATKINLIDNRATDDGEYDQAALALLLQSLEGDYTGTGFDDGEVEELLSSLEEAAGEDADTVPYSEPEASFNDSAEEREARRISHGGPDSRTMESRGIRDIILALEAAKAEELGRLVMKLRENLGALSQGEVVLAAARIAVAVMEREAIEGGAADCPFDAEQPWRPGDSPADGTVTEENDA